MARTKTTSGNLVTIREPYGINMAQEAKKMNVTKSKLGQLALIAFLGMSDSQSV